MSTPQLDLIGIVVEDMTRSLAFYRRLGLDVPAEADAEPHVEAGMPGGLRLAWDALDTARTFDPDHPAPSGNGNIGLVFRLDTPAAGVDTTYDTLTAAGYDGH
jgi:catechol 2,3-dioxygenase-like lactoylglutathione lyase family enzyme